MGYPGYPSYPPYSVYPPAQPPRSGADLTISIVTLVFTALLGVGAVVFGFFSLAFLDYCPPESCSAEGAATAVMVSLGVTTVIGLAGITVTIIQLVRRKRAWPFAAGTLTLCVIALCAGVVGYIAAVGG